MRGANAQRTGYDVKVGDLVLEVLSGPVPCMHESVKGPFRVVQVGSNGTVWLSTGGTQFKEAATFPRHVSNLALY